ncbi:putative histidine kinase HHK3p [Pseudovirgaria hyperparasitica]|uniref:histidine kinase n=1 Tax=Pseudovirgaria hyperparasitica TaxID=470096 RepID=A0A6A6WBZ8_9PEZI|nr:putative histidine kinase HHK3p [Pseudovirgaria hyperparasitica]KAF2760362.1 putative histidine kinase HHK3p [Pseudovirgaria hyperparasitica]
MVTEVEPTRLAPRVQFVPSAETRLPLPRQDSPPQRPADVGPILDPDNYNLPLDSWTEDYHFKYYPEKEHKNAPSPEPQSPPEFKDAYLSPVLARNERLRLTILWYYTRGLEGDKDLLLRIQEKVRLVREIIGWEFALTGLLDNDVYTRIAAVGLPLAILPRRESTCAHTINQDGLFMLTNMDEDWRFQKSPHVQIGGLRSYAGCALKIETEFGEKVALGSLCVASNTPQAPLSPTKQAALDSFADMITAELVHAAKLRRQRDRHHMSDLIARLEGKLFLNCDAETLVLDTLREKYPHAVVSLQQSGSDQVALSGRDAIPYTDVVDGVYEDTEYLESIIATSNHTSLSSQRTVRAIVRKCQQFQTPTYMIVASNDVQFVFDDVDSGFVERCALAFSTYRQEQDLNKALKAKDIFLRGITHQLRTPIHGVLGSVELLAEELKARKLLSDQIEQLQAPLQEFDASPFIRTIKSSGRDLMTIVDSMLKLNRWDDVSHKPTVVSLSELREMEVAILSDIAQTFQEEAMTGKCVFYLNQLQQQCATLTIDLVLLKDCLQHLVMNAIQNTQSGLINVTISSSPDCQSLIVDVEDTGCGIPQQDHTRIFEPYEKIDPHSKGIGLGLTLASKLANLMDGTVSLVQSTVGKGSHFRMHFRNPRFAPEVNQNTPLIRTLRHLPSVYSLHSSSGVVSQLSDHFAQYLRSRGLEHSTKSNDSLAIIDYTEDADSFESIVKSLDPMQVAVCLVPSGRRYEHLERIPDARRVVILRGPYTSNQLDCTLSNVDSLLAPPLETQNETVVEGQTDTQRVVITTPSSVVCLQEEHKPPPAQHINSPNAITEVTIQATINIRSTPPSFSPPLSPRETAEAPFALLVDDNSVNLQIISMYCKKRKIPYVTAINGEKAVAAFSNPRLPSPYQHRRVNLILMDLQMPVKDGIDATREIRALEKQLGLPRSVVLMVTGQDSPVDRVRSAEAGADGFFVKPVAMKALDQGIKGHFPEFGGAGV